MTAAGERTRVEFAEYMLPIIRERRENPGDDLLSALCSAEVDGVRMSDEDVKAFCSLLLAARRRDHRQGHRRHLREPARPPRPARRRPRRPLADTARLRGDPAVHPAGPHDHAAVRDGGHRQRRHHTPGATVTCLIGAANRDERRYADPDRFDIFREDLTTTTAFSAAADHLAFALGRHFCVGALLAKAEVETGMNQLLDAMPDVRLADGFRTAEEGVFTRGVQSLPVRFTPVQG